MSPLSSLLLLSLVSLAFSVCTTCQQNAASSTNTQVTMDPTEMGARLGRQLADKLRFMSYLTEHKSSFSPSDFPPSLFASLGLPVSSSSSSLPQAAPQFPFRPIPQQPNGFVPQRKGGCPYCRG